MYMSDHVKRHNNRLTSLEWALFHRRKASRSAGHPGVLSNLVQRKWLFPCLCYTLKRGNMNQDSCKTDVMLPFWQLLLFRLLCHSIMLFELSATLVQTSTAG